MVVTHMFTKTYVFQMFLLFYMSLYQNTSLTNTWKIHMKHMQHCKYLEILIITLLTVCILVTRNVTILYHWILHNLELPLHIYTPLYNVILEQ